MFSMLPSQIPYSAFLIPLLLSLDPYSSCLWMYGVLLLCYPAMVIAFIFLSSMFLVGIHGYFAIPVNSMFILSLLNFKNLLKGYLIFVFPQFKRTGVVSFAPYTLISNLRALLIVLAALTLTNRKTQASTSTVTLLRLVLRSWPRLQCLKSFGLMLFKRLFT